MCLPLMGPPKNEQTTTCATPTKKVLDPNGTAEVFVRYWRSVDARSAATIVLLDFCRCVAIGIVAKPSLVLTSHRRDLP